MLWQPYASPTRCASGTREHAEVGIFPRLTLMSLVWTADETHMSSVASVLLGAAGLVPLVLALGDPATTPQPLHAESDAPSRRRAPGARGARGHGGTATRVRPRTALQVAACLLN